jgi:hypothetical protein
MNFSVILVLDLYASFRLAFIIWDVQTPRRYGNRQCCADDEMNSWLVAIALFVDIAQFSALDVCSCGAGRGSRALRLAPSRHSLGSPCRANCWECRSVTAGAPTLILRRGQPSAVPTGVAPSDTKCVFFRAPIRCFYHVFQRFFKKNQNRIFERCLAPNLRPFKDLQVIPIAIFAGVNFVRPAVCDATPLQCVKMTARVCNAAFCEQLVYGRLTAFVPDLLEPTTNQAFVLFDHPRRPPPKNLSHPRREVHHKNRQRRPHLSGLPTTRPREKSREK